MVCVSLYVNLCVSQDFRAMFTAKTFFTQEELLLYKFCFLKNLPLSYEKTFVLDRLKELLNFLEPVEGGSCVVLRGLEEVVLHFSHEDRERVLGIVFELKKHLRMDVGCDLPAVRPSCLAGGDVVPESGTVPCGEDAEMDVEQCGVTADLEVIDNVSVCETQPSLGGEQMGCGVLENEPYPFKGPNLLYIAK